MDAQEKSKKGKKRDDQSHRKENTRSLAPLHCFDRQELEFNITGAVKQFFIKG